MNKKKIVDLIDAGDVSLVYDNKDIFIDPRTEDGEWHYYLGYMDYDGWFGTVDELMSAKVIDGKSLNDICDDLEML